MAQSINLDEIINSLKGMDGKEKLSILKDAEKIIGKKKWVPAPGPQTEAYYSKADILLFGGSPGGGKTDLGLGLAFNEHRRSRVIRLKYSDLGRILDRAIEIHGSNSGVNKSSPPKIQISKDQVIQFGGVNNDGSEQSFQGQDCDYLYVDEALQISQKKIRFLMGWLRSSVEGQRKRVVLGTNPPLSSEGDWVFEYFAPWIDPDFPDPAEQGELRWAVMNADDKTIWCENSDPVMVDGSLRYPMSRTYINSTVANNPFIDTEEYQKQLDNITGAERDLLLGGFQVSNKDKENQIIKSAWIRASMDKWTPLPPDGIPMCAIGVDCSGGSDDPLVISPRYDGWYAPIISIPGRDIPIETIGATSAAHVIANRRDNAEIIVDMGGGYGNAIYEKLTGNGMPVTMYKGSYKSRRRTKSGKLYFANQRTEAYWRLAEALDPEQIGGSRVILPNNKKLLADLSAVTFDVKGNVIHAKTKEKVCADLGRSTDEGDAVVMAWFGGIKNENIAGGFKSSMGYNGKNTPVINRGYAHMKKKRR